jgi:hypothetical protein
LNIMNGLKLVCGVLGLLLVVQIGSALSGDDSRGGLDPSGISEPGASPTPVGSDSQSAGGKENGGKKSTVQLPAVFQPIVDRHVFGKKPPRPPLPIVLEGIAHDWAFLRTPKGRSAMAKVGETVDGVKVLEIRQNRVLVEHKGEKKELVINQGLGSEPILPPAGKTAGGDVKPNTKPENRAPSKPQGQEQRK